MKTPLTYHGVGEVANINGGYKEITYLRKGAIATKQMWDTYS